MKPLKAAISNLDLLYNDGRFGYEAIDVRQSEWQSELLTDSKS